jgi:hypothetical protein
MIGAGLTILKIPDPTLTNDVAGATLIATGMGIHVYQANDEYGYSENIRNRFYDAVLPRLRDKDEFNMNQYLFVTGQLTLQEWYETDPVGLMDTYPAIFAYPTDWWFPYYLELEHPFVAA